MINSVPHLRRPTVSAPVERYNCPCCGSPIADEGVANDVDDRQGIPHRTVTTDCDVCGKFQTSYRLLGSVWQKQGRTVRLQSVQGKTTVDRSHNGAQPDDLASAQRRFNQTPAMTAAARRRAKGRK